MTSHHPSELDPGVTGSVSSSPRSDHLHSSHPDPAARLRFMCSFGGKILPRPHDNQLRYVGGDTRIVAVPRSANFSALLAKLSKLSGTANVMVKYQLPNEDLDALISVTTDEDVENMMEEYDRLAQNQNPRAARLRLFLFPKGEDSRSSSIGSMLGDSANRDHWFFDALNGRPAAPLWPGLERGRSEASSIVSEVPDYLFGLENSDDTATTANTQQRGTRAIKARPIPSDVSVSDPGSPDPVASPPFNSTSSAPCAPSMPHLPPVKTRPYSPDPPKDQNQTAVGFPDAVDPTVSQQTGHPGNPMLSYIAGTNHSGQPVQPIPIYFFPGQVPPGNVPVHPIPLQAPFVQPYPPLPGQIPVGFPHHVPGMGQVYGGGLRPVTSLDSYDTTSMSAPWVYSDNFNQQHGYYDVQKAAVLSSYAGVVVPPAEEVQGPGVEIKAVPISQ